MNSKKPIAILMAAAMTVASLSAVSLYADDVYDTALLETGSGSSDTAAADPSGEPDVRIDGETEDSEAQTSEENSADISSSDETTPVTNPPVNTVRFNELSTGLLKGYIEMPSAPSSLKGNSISAFDENMRCVSVAGESLNAAGNDLTINVDTITGTMASINGKAKAYAMLYRFDKNSTITVTSGYNLTATDKNDGAAWKALNAPDDDYQYIVVWYNASTLSTAIVFREDKIVNGKREYATQTVRVTRRDTTPYDPEITTPETTTAPEDMVSEISTDWPLKTTITDRRGTVNLGEYRLMVDPCNEIFLNTSSRFPSLVTAIKEDKAFTYEIELERGNVARDVTGSFKVTMSLPEKIKSNNSVYLYKASGSSYSPIEIADQKSGEVSFVTYELGMRIIISTVNLNGYTGETTTATGTGTASPVITAGANSALSGAEIQVYSNAMLPNGTRLQITALNTAQSNNRAVELAISEGRALPYDISLVNASGTAVSQNNINAISVSFNVPSQFSGNNTLYVYRRESDDTFTNMNATVSGGKISFVTRHLSTYIISTVAFDGSGVVTDNSGNIVTTTKKPSNSGNNGGGSQVIINGGGSSGTNNPGTGFLFVLVPVGLAAAGIVITRKKKR